MRSTFIWILLSLIIFGLKAAGKEPYISFSYRDARVEEIILDLKQRYDLAFSYGRNPDLLNYKITARSGLIKIEDGLRYLFTGTPIEYRIISGQVALRYNRQLANQLLSQREATTESPPRRKRRKASPPPAEVAVVDKEPELPPATPERDIPSPAQPIPTETATEVPWVSSPIVTSKPAEIPTSRKKRQLGQISFLPGVSSNPGKEREYINTISFNLPAGVSGGVVGAEFGILYNGIDGDLVGAQIGGLVNVVDKNLIGVQIAGLGNGAGIGTGVQIAGGFNYCRRTLRGTQIAGLVNVALNGVSNQYAPLNISEGDVKTQIGLFNRGQNVSRSQIGLINISDTIVGLPIGLFNFVRKGYNTIEFSRTSVMPYAVSLKLGARRFYNVFELSGGFRRLQKIDEEGTARQLVWGLGYGFGWASRAGKNPHLRWHTEIVGSHINRRQLWVDRLNFVLSIRHTFDWRTSGHTHFYIGPVLNFHWSQLTDQELDNLFVSGWQLWQSRYDTVKFRGVLGIRFGLRIGKH